MTTISPQVLKLLTETAAKEVELATEALAKAMKQATEAQQKPVSYTHLDVYKRQGLYSIQFKKLSTFCA